MGELLSSPPITTPDAPPPSADVVNIGPSRESGRNSANAKLLVRAAQTRWRARIRERMIRAGISRPRSKLVRRLATIHEDSWPRQCPICNLDVQSLDDYSAGYHTVCTRLYPSRAAWEAALPTSRMSPLPPSETAFNCWAPPSAPLPASTPLPEPSPTPASSTAEC